MTGKALLLVGGVSDGDVLGNGQRTNETSV